MRSPRLTAATAILVTAVTTTQAHHPHDVVTFVRVSPDYRNDQTVYIAIQGTFDLLLRSTDGGTSWNPTHEGMRGRTPTDFAFSPDFATDRTVYVATDRAGVDVSTDGGDHWGPTSIGTGHVRAIGLSPQFADDRLLLASTKKGLLRSADGGATSTVVLAYPEWPMPHAFCFSPNFAQDGTIYAAADTAGLLRSTDTGFTWEVVPTGHEPLDVRDVAMAPNFDQDPTLLLATWGRGILASHDGGLTWERYEGGPIPMDPYVTSITLSPTYEESGLAMATTATSGVLRTDDGGHNWRPIPLPFIPYTRQTSIHFRDFAFSPDFGRDGQYFVALFEGLYCYRPEARWPWHASRILHTRIGRRVQISPSFGLDSTVVATGYGFEVLFSKDQGRNWEIRNIGSGSISNYSLALSPDFAVDSTIASGTGWGVEISPDAGRSWEWYAFEEGNYSSPEDDNPLGATKAIQFSPEWSLDSTIYAGNWWTVQKSTDGGRHWHHTLDLRNKCYDMAISPSYPTDGTLFVVGGSKLYRTTDRAETWTPWGEGLNPSGLRFIELSPGFAQDSVAFIAYTADGVARSTDGGRTWESRSPRMPDVNVNALVVSGNFVEDRTVAVATHGAGVLVSTNAGGAWERRWPEGLEGGYVESLAISPEFDRDGVMVAGSYGGFYVTWDGGTHWTRTTTVERYDDRRTDTADWWPDPEPPILGGTPPIVYLTQRWPQGRDFDWFSAYGKQWAEGYATWGTVPQSALRFQFVGTGVDWIGARGPDFGFAAWSLDGGVPDTLDLWAPAPEHAVPVLSVDQLAPGLHTLEIEVLGDGIGHMWDQAVVVDAFDVHYGAPQTFASDPMEEAGRRREQRNSLVRGFRGDE